MHEGMVGVRSVARHDAYSKISMQGNRSLLVKIYSILSLAALLGMKRTLRGLMRFMECVLAMM